MAKRKKAEVPEVIAEPPVMPTETRKPKGRPKSANQKGNSPIVLTVRANDEYREWLVEAAAIVGEKVKIDSVERSFLFDQAMTLLAEHFGIRKPPKRT